MATELNRRNALRLLTLGAGGLLVAACTPAVPSAALTPVPPASGTAAPAGAAKPGGTAQPAAGQPKSGGTLRFAQTANPVSSFGEGRKKDKEAGPSVRNLMSAVTIEELSWGDAGLYLSIPNPGLGGAAVAAAGTPEQRQRFLARFKPPVRFTVRPERCSFTDITFPDIARTPIARDR